MKKTIISALVLFIGAASSFALITQEQANTIVQNYVKTEVTQPTALYANVNAPNEEGIVITTSNGETFKAKYACWTYCLDESDPVQRRYFFVKEENGSLLEIIASNDLSELDASWTVIITGLAEKEIKLLYPNPVSDFLNLSCNGENTRIEIYDLKGTRFFSGLLSETCQLNVSFLKTGIYLVNVSGETYKIIKN